MTVIINSMSNFCFVSSQSFRKKLYIRKYTIVIYTKKNKLLYWKIIITYYVRQIFSSIFCYTSVNKTNIFEILVTINILNKLFK